MATVSPVADALIRPQVPEAQKWQYLVVPLQEAKGLRRPTIRGHPTSSTTSVGRVGKPSACRSSTATSWPGQSCCSSDRSTDRRALGRDRGNLDPAIPSTPSRSPASKDEVASCRAPPSASARCRAAPRVTDGRAADSLIGSSTRPPRWRRTCGRASDRQFPTRAPEA